VYIWLTQSAGLAQGQLPGDGRIRCQHVMASAVGTAAHSQASWHCAPTPARAAAGLLQLIISSQNNHKEHINNLAIQFTNKGSR